MMGNQNVGNPHTFIQMIRCGVVYQPYVLISLWHRKILDQQFYFEPCHPEVLSLHNLENPVLDHLSHLWVCNVELFIPLGWPKTFKVDLQPVASYFLVAAGESEVYQTGARMIITPDGRNRMPQYACYCVPILSQLGGLPALSVTGLSPDGTICCTNVF